MDIGRSIEVARANTPPDRVACVQADVAALPLASGAVDWAYSLGVLHHTTHPERGLADIVDAVRPGGLVLLYLYYSLEHRSPLSRGLFHVVDLRELWDRLRDRPWVPEPRAELGLQPLHREGNIDRLRSTSPRFGGFDDIGYVMDSIVGIALNAVHLLADALRRGSPARERVITLGVQDCHFDYPTLVRFLDRHGIPHQDAVVEATTGFAWVTPGDIDVSRFIHQRTLFHALGFRDICALDYSAFEGAEVVHDLNLPIRDALAGQFDLVFDGGTIEHVFTISEALFSCARLCRVGGVVVHIAPADMANHGLFNLSAEVFRDFYCQNGFRELAVKYVGFPKDRETADRWYLSWAPNDFVHGLQPFCDTAVYAAFIKERDVTAVVPQQGFYERLWGGNGNVTPMARPRIRRLVAHWTRRYFIPAMLVHGYRMLRRAERVPLS